SSAIPAAVTVIVAALGKHNSSPNWLIPTASLSPSPTTPPVLRNGTPSNIVSSPRSPRTGLANRSTAIRRSSTSFAPPELNPACRSTLISTVATISPAPYPHLNNFKHSASSPTKSCPSGTTLSHPICEIIFASILRRKLRVVDEKILLTDNFLLSAKNIQTPMSGFITRVLQRAATSILQTSDLSLLREQKSQIDAHTLELKAFSPAIVALDKQKALLEEYESHLLPWRTAVANQYRLACKNLVD